MQFNDPKLMSCARLVAVLAFAARCGLATLVADRVRIAAKGHCGHIGLASGRGCCC